MNVNRFTLLYSHLTHNISYIVAIGTAGIVSNMICVYSLYVLKTTGCGLPPGPFGRYIFIILLLLFSYYPQSLSGLEGAAEGISYLAVVGLFGWSLTKKIKTGSGLPVGKFGLLGGAEGLTFLTVLGGLAIAGLNLQEYGFLPGFLPNDQCFGINN